MKAKNKNTKVTPKKITQKENSKKHLIKVKEAYS